MGKRRQQGVLFYGPNPALFAVSYPSGCRYWTRLSIPSLGTCNHLDDREASPSRLAFSHSRNEYDLCITFRRGPIPRSAIFTKPACLLRVCGERAGARTQDQRLKSDRHFLPRDTFDSLNYLHNRVPLS